MCTPIVISLFGMYSAIFRLREGLPQKMEPGGAHNIFAQLCQYKHVYFWAFG